MGQIIIIMGVSGCGKSTIGGRIAADLNAIYLEGDELHPESNIAKMSSGQPLTDVDRWPWFDRIISAANREAENYDFVLVGCSALKESYRDYLAEKLVASPRFIHLTGSFETIHNRMKEREHFMPAHLLKSQFETLEAPVPEGRKCLDLPIDQPVEKMVKEATNWLLQ